MMNLIKLLSAIPGVITGVETILRIFTSYFPPKTREERAVDKYKRKMREIRSVQNNTSKQIKDAKHGRTRAIERLLNRK